MKKFLNKLDVVHRWMRGYVSPVFIALFCASFILWYIIKLGNVYTTNYDLRINIDGESLRVPCVVEGVGTNLLGYKVYQHKELKFALSDLKYAVEQEVDDETGSVLGLYCVIDPQSLQNAITLRFSDIKVLNVGDIPIIPMPSAEDSLQMNK